MQELKKRRKTTEKRTNQKEIMKFMLEEMIFKFSCTHQKE